MASTVLESEDKRRVTDRIFIDLRESIVSGGIRRGAKLPTERQLAEQYAVSVPMVREAIRGLAATGFVEVRHGSGTYVSVRDDSLVAMALSSVMQLQDVHARDALDLLGLFIEYAANAAVARASSADLRRLRDAAEACNDRDDLPLASAAIKEFHHALAAATHNPLLLALNTFLVTVQTEFMQEAARHAPEAWRAETTDVQAARLQFVEAIEARRGRAAVTHARTFTGGLMRALTRVEATILANPEAPSLDMLMARALGRVARQ